jgi:hypothetical protein
VAYYYIGSSRDRQWRKATISQDYTQWETPLPCLTNAGEVAPLGKSTAASALPFTPPARRLRDYSYEYSQPSQNLIGQDRIYGAAGEVADYDWQLPVKAPRRTGIHEVGVNSTLALDAASQAGSLPLIATQVLALPPSAQRRLRDYTWEYSQPAQNLIGQDAVYGGAGQVADYDWQLPPRRAPRLSDYSFVETLFAPLIGTDSMAAGAQLIAPAPPARARCASFDPGTNYAIWLDLASQVPIPAGKSTAVTELPSKPPPRSRDYSYTESLFAPLIGTDAMVTGAQLVASAAPARARCISFDPGTNLTVWLDLASQAVQGPGQSTARTELPKPSPARARDYSFTQSTFPALIGTDAMVAGEQTFALPTPPRPRLVWFDPGQNFTIYAAAFIAPVGVQSFDLPPRTSSRARDYTQLDRLPNLIGQDAVNPGQSTDRTALPQPAPKRSRDYTWLQTYPLYIYEQLPAGQSTDRTVLPPKGPLRLKDYTHLDLTKRHLIGQDAMAPGQQWLRTDNLPPRAYARMRDYSLLVHFDLSSLAETTHPGKHTLTDRALFLHSLSDRALFEHTLSHRPLFVHTDTDSVPVG